MVLQGQIVLTAADYEPPREEAVLIGNDCQYEKKQQTSYEVKSELLV